MLAAGVGSRLTGKDDSGLPKSLLRFDGQTLLERHIENLVALGVEDLTLVVGYRADDLIAEIDRLGRRNFVRFVTNDDYRRGSIVSLWTGRDTLTSGSDVLFMDADVLYHPALLSRLVNRDSSCFAFDRGFVPGDEPVKLCFRNGVPVEFRKKVEVDFDNVGEWPGFLTLAPEMAMEVARITQAYMDQGRQDQPCEEVFRDVLLSAPQGAFTFEDVTGIPWIEIDFPEDISRAQDEILPRIHTFAA